MDEDLAAEEERVDRYNRSRAKEFLESFFLPLMESFQKKSVKKTFKWTPRLFCEERDA